MDEVADADGFFVSGETEALAEGVGEDAADDETQAGGTPDDADAGGSALENDFAEEGEEHLGGAASAGPSDVRHSDGEDEGRRAHVGDAFAKVGEEGMGVVLGYISAGGAKVAFGRAQKVNGGGAEDEGGGVDNEGPFVTELHGGGTAQERADGEGDPGGGLRDGVSGMELIGRGDAREDGGPAAGEERGREHEQAAERVEKPALVVREDEDEAEGDDGAEEVACDHDAATVEAVEEDAGEGAGKHGGERAGDHDAADGDAGTGEMEC